MFTARYYAPRYFANRYFPPTGGLILVKVIKLIGYVRKTITLDGFIK